MITVITQFPSFTGVAVPATPSSPVPSVLVDTTPISAVADGVLDLVERVPDPRKPRGVRHRLATVLAVALAATIAGARSFTAIFEWAADTDTATRAALGITTGVVPSESTIRRCLQRLAADGLDQLIGAWLTDRATTSSDGRRVIAFDGKTLRGARDAAGNLVHLLAGLCQHTGAVLAQIAVGAKTNEIPLLRTLIATMDLTGVVVTADAPHCQRDTATAIVDAGAHYILTAKANQPTLLRQLKTLPWKQVPVLDRTTEHGHGRTTTRRLKTTEIAAGIEFPHAIQVLQLTRTLTHRKTGARHSETVYAVTSMSTTDAHPRQIATWLRGHWAIEDRLHWVRDVTYHEDHSQVRTGAGPQVMATLRNTAISLLRLAGHTNIAKALRHNARHPQRPIRLLLTS